MNAAGSERAAAAGQGRPDVPPGSEAQFTSSIASGIALLAALRRLSGALRELATVEGRLLLAGIPLFFIAATALVAFSVSLWVCVVALIGWALMYGTHSLGLALGLLVVIHAVLVVGVWSAIKYSLRQATFPRARAELRLLGRSVRHEIGRFAGSASASGRAAGRAPDHGDST